MKPSEYLIQNKIVIGKNPSVIWTLLNKMDKQFKDVEELKEKILFIFENTGLMQPCGEYEPSNVLDCSDVYFEPLKNKILKLLEE